MFIKNLTENFYFDTLLYERDWVFNIYIGDI